MPEETPRAPWRRRIGTAPKTWVAVMAAAICLGWFPFLTRPLSPDEAGFLIVGGQWSPGHSLYGAYWVDRPPLLIALFGLADALGGAVPLRLIGTLAAVLSVVLSGNLGRLAAPERRSAPLLTAGAAAVCVSTPLFGGSLVNGELLGLPFLLAGLAAYVAAAASPSASRGFVWALASGAAASLAVCVKQSLVDVGVLVVVLCLTSRHARQRLPGFLVGALATLAVVLALAWWRGTPPAEVWDASITFRIDAARTLAADDGSGAERRLWIVIWSLVGSLVPLLVAALAWRGRGRPSAQGPWTAPDVRVAAYAVLTAELLVVFLGGGYWQHYLTGLTPGVVLLAAAFAQRAAPVTRSVGAAYVLAGLSSLACIGSSVVHPYVRGEHTLIDYLRAHDAAGDTGVVVFGEPNILRDSGLTSPYPYLWSLPARVRDRDLATLEGLLADDSARPTWVMVAPGAVRRWGLDFDTAQGELDADYTREATVGPFVVYHLAAGR